MSLTLIAATLLCGLLIRFAPLGLSPVITKYGGSFLWAVMIYWIVSSLLHNRTPAASGVVTSLVTALVELFKLVHNPVLDHFRHTLAGALLLGRVFSFADIGVYWCAIVAAVFLDQALRTYRTPRQPPKPTSARI